MGRIQVLVQDQNLSYAISQFKTRRTPDGPAIIGVSEIENITVLQDLVKAKDIADRNLQVVRVTLPTGVESMSAFSTTRSSSG